MCEATGNEYKDYSVNIWDLNFLMHNMKVWMGRSQFIILLNFKFFVNDLNPDFDADEADM